jgi:hypothetical protein
MQGVSGGFDVYKRSVLRQKDALPAEALAKVSSFHIHSATQVREDHAEHGKS